MRDSCTLRLALNHASDSPRGASCWTVGLWSSAGSATAVVSAWRQACLLAWRERYASGAGAKRFRAAGTRLRLVPRPRRPASGDSRSERAWRARSRTRDGVGGRGRPVTVRSSRSNSVRQGAGGTNSTCVVRDESRGGDGSRRAQFAKRCLSTVTSVSPSASGAGERRRKPAALARADGRM